MKPTWRRQENNFITMAFFAALYLDMFVGMIFQFEQWYFYVGLFVVTFFTVFLATESQHDTFVKVFLETPWDAKQVVQKVLEAKGIPFKRVDGTRFLLEGNDVEIRVTAFKGREVQGTAVYIRPLSDSSTLLVGRLRDKIDEAFRPRAL